MRKFFQGWFLAAELVLLACVGASYANYDGTQGTGTHFVAFDATHSGTSLCAAANTQCTAFVPITSAGVEILPSTAANQSSILAAIQAPIAAGTNVIGGVTQSGTWNIGTVTSVSQFAGVAPTLGDVNNVAAIAGVLNVGPVARYNATLPTLTDTRYNLFQVDVNGRVLTAMGSQYPSGATPITASATGTTAATTATLAGTAGKTTYICGYSIRANATGAATVTNTITGVITATLSSIMWVAPLASGIGIDEQIFSPCIPASGTNTGIAIVSGAPGSGGTVSSKGWGYQL